MCGEALTRTANLSLPRDQRGYLWDVLGAADAIIEFTGGLDHEAYAASSITHSAVERKFEIIGEALNLLNRVDPEIAAKIPERFKIIAFRNLLAHGYAVVEHERVWDIAHKELLTLRTAVVDILAELETDR